MKNRCSRLDNAGLWDGSLLTFDSLPSTNDWCLAELRNLSHGDVIRAVRQTAGRGRFDRTWHSFDDQCLTLSFVVNTRIAGNDLTHWVGPIAAISLAHYLQKNTVEAVLKWPNDVLARGRKIAGILSQKDDAANMLVCGIGLNINIDENDLAGISPTFPATSMLIETREIFPPEEVLTELLTELENAFSSVRDCGTAWILHAWGKCDFLTGKKILVAMPDGTTVAGKYSGMTLDGQLSLTDDSGTTRTFWTGDVTLRTENRR